MDIALKLPQGVCPVNSMNALFLILFEFLKKGDLQYFRAAL